jgi:hypothetical protein
VIYGAGRARCSVGEFVARLRDAGVSNAIQFDYTLWPRYTAARNTAGRAMLPLFGATASQTISLHALRHW